MVEKLAVRYPEFGQRVQERAKAKHVSIRDIQHSLQVTYEMARRYYNGIAKPRGKGMQLLAGTLGCQVAWLEYGSQQPGMQAREDAANYATLDDEARNIALAWSQLPELKKQLYRDAIFRDAALNEIFSAQSSVPIRGSSYIKFVNSVRHQWEKTLRQFKPEL